VCTHTCTVCDAMIRVTGDRGAKRSPRVLETREWLVFPRRTRVSPISLGRGLLFFQRRPGSCEMDRRSNNNGTEENAIDVRVAEWRTRDHVQITRTLQDARYINRHAFSGTPSPHRAPRISRISEQDVDVIKHFPCREALARTDARRPKRFLIPFARFPAKCLAIMINDRTASCGIARLGYYIMCIISYSTLMFSR